jgi:chromosome segregation protein
VDAALDEANTQRFVVLVREFLATSQFIIITHAKRTIAMADEIYGVTMQEPGVSKRISVRFEQAAELAEVPDEAIMA